MIDLGIGLAFLVALVFALLRPKSRATVEDRAKDQRMRFAGAACLVTAAVLLLIKFV